MVPAGAETPGGTFTRGESAPWQGAHNNQIERDLRGVVVGRKNHYGSRSERGTQVAAILYSLVETAKHYGIPEQVYLRKAAEHALLNPDSTLLPHQLLG